MGRLVSGIWHPGWYAPNEKGTFERVKTSFRSWVRADGSTEFAAEAGRYHLYVSHACPWAHRTILTRALRGLEHVIDMTVVDPHMGEDGWFFSDVSPDPLFHARFLREIYTKADAHYTGNVTVPILWDKKTATVVNNESREVMRMLDTEFDALAKNPKTLCPPALKEKIDSVLDAIYSPINNGVYRAGFATAQKPYEEACQKLFAALAEQERILAAQRFTCGNDLTEADLALFTTLLRFDVVYYSHFKCNLHRIQDLPNLWGFLRDIYQRPVVKAVCHLDHIKTHYYWSQNNVNPTRIVPLGPNVDYDAPHDRARFG
ncbi:MAG: glutathione S-transferase family protein [Polyangiaceae bacterium]